jgi:hypothetical protein
MRGSGRGKRCRRFSSLIVANDRGAHGRPARLKLKLVEKTSTIGKRCDAHAAPQASASKMASAGCTLGTKVVSVQRLWLKVKRAMLTSCVQRRASLDICRATAPAKDLFWMRGRGGRATPRQKIEFFSFFYFVCAPADEGAHQQQQPLSATSQRSPLQSAAHPIACAPVVLGPYPAQAQPCPLWRFQARAPSTCSCCQESCCHRMSSLQCQAPCSVNSMQNCC